MILASSLVHAPPTTDEITCLADVFPGWIEPYTEAPCGAEMGTIRVHRDGRCVHCLALEVADRDPA